MIYICYGVTKSASTFLYQLTEEVFLAARRKPARLGPPHRPCLSVENYFDDIDLKLLNQVTEQANGADVVLKTHGRLNSEIALLIERGAIKASASIRDPREIALSLLDHGRRARRWRNRPFSEFQDIADTLASLDNQLAIFRAWSSVRDVLVCEYNDICFNTAAVIEKIAAQVGIYINTASILTTFEDKGIIGQFSTGTPSRYHDMPHEQQRLFLERYADFYRDFRFDERGCQALSKSPGSAPRQPRGQLSQHFVDARRLVRYWLG